MKKLLLISILTLIYLGCKHAKTVNQTITIPTNTVAESKEQKIAIPPIDYCVIVDSLLALPEYNYNLVKPNTKYVFYPIESMADSLPQVRQWKKEGYRVAVISERNGKSLVYNDSMRYIGWALYLAGTIYEKRLQDSIFNVTNHRLSLQELDKLIYQRYRLFECPK